MTIAENIEMTRMSLSSPLKTPTNGEEKKRSRLKSRTSEPPQSQEKPLQNQEKTLQNQEKTVKFKAKKEKPKIPKKRHDSSDDDEEEVTGKVEEKPPVEFRNFLTDKK